MQVLGRVAAQAAAIGVAISPGGQSASAESMDVETLVSTLATELNGLSSRQLRDRAFADQVHLHRILHALLKKTCKTGGCLLKISPCERVGADFCCTYPGD